MSAGPLYKSNPRDYRHVFRLLVLSLALSCVACASRNTTSEEEVAVKNVDPFEVINRPLYQFNDLTDRFILRPLGQGYNFVMPRTARNGVGNFYDNITYPRTIINDFLQAKFKQGFADTGRFALNSTLGLLGFVDVASAAGLEPHIEDFGQTFASWGIPSGPYIVVPIIGPRTVRSGIGTWFDVQVNPLVQYDNSSVRDKMLILWAVESRAALIGPDKAVLDAFDPYLFVRDAYLQNREFLNNDGQLSGGGDFDADFDDGLDDDF